MRTSLPRGFDALSFLNREFGDADGVLRLLKDYGALGPGRAAVRKWFTRASIPGAWLPVLLVYLEAERGAPVSMARYAVVSRDA